MRYYIRLVLLVGFIVSSLPNNGFASDIPNDESSATHAADSNIISNDKVRDFLTALVDDSIRSSQDTPGLGSHLFYIPGVLTPNYSFTLDELVQSLAHDETPRGKYDFAVVNITAHYLKSVKANKDITYFELTTFNNEIVIAKAYLSELGMSQSHDYQKGQEITLQCENPQKADYIVFSQCHKLVELPEDIRAYSRNVIEQYLAGHDISSLLVDDMENNPAESLFLFGYLANLTPMDEKCYEIGNLSQCAEMKTLFSLLNKNNERDKYHQAYEKAKKFYHLP
ncbi:hypothetical protein N5853_13715 (plasmid) [Bartonella sp. HY329]|uniref:hypothetical protein n=1 Tax=unclassified Bartonella TaxID=2645622 RepID=UPI0021C9A778|nr:MULTISPECIES: hypothetical protein [unclassified Bartonella]UXM96589.1 hypothetical protein N5853_13715 [Bartonella sp. HY329]UXN10912.1 hypothetical protein N5852_13720 [Bartonella sp. HY328]